MNTALKTVEDKFLKVTIGFVVDASLVDDMSVLADVMTTLQGYGEATIIDVEVIRGNYSDDGEWISGEKT